MIVFVFKKWGITVPIIMFGCGVVGELLGEQFFGAGYCEDHLWPVGISYIVAGMVLYVMTRSLTPASSPATGSPYQHEAVATSDPNDDVEMEMLKTKVPIVHATAVISPMPNSVVALPPTTPSVVDLGHFMCIPFRYWSLVSGGIGTIMILLSISGVTLDDDAMDGN